LVVVPEVDRPRLGVPREAGGVVKVDAETLREWTKCPWGEETRLVTVAETRWAALLSAAGSIGPLLDAWDAVPNDAKDYAEDNGPGLRKAFEDMREAVEGP
jgi:hypothetical protein